jgi:arginyl-tRNA synthetase
MLELIRADLATLGVHHDLFASEQEVQESGAVDRAFALLADKGMVYTGTLPPPKGKAADDWEPTELLLFRSTAFGDDQDRPIKKSDGSWTYFAADTAYHMKKLEASDELINVWGADHTGTVKRTQAAVEALAGPACARRQDRADGAAAARRASWSRCRSVPGASSPSPKW